MAHQSGETRRRRARQRAEREEKALKALAKSRKEFKGKKKSKKKTAEDLIGGPIHNHQGFWIRKPENWVSRSYNYDRQVIDLASFLFCKYPAPYFMFEIFLKSKTHLSRLNKNILTSRYPKEKEELFFHWFITIAQGGKFAKVTKEYFTKKEAHLFVNAPRNNTILENIWWARCTARSLPENIKNYLCSRGLIDRDFKDEFWLKVLDFLANNMNDLDLHILQELMDYLRQVRTMEPEFSLKGRTLGSLIRLSNEWHVRIQKAKMGGMKRWDGLPYKDWHYHDKAYGRFWEIVQLKSSKELYTEGRRMKHCVYVYTRSCLEGKTGIFSMASGPQKDFMDEKHLTIELSDDGRIIQVRGKLNRASNKNENRILNRWVGALNLKGWLL